MLIRKFAHARKSILAVAATTLLAGAFQAGGCTINVDQNLLNSLSSLLDHAGGLPFGPGNGPHVNEGPRHGSDHPPTTGDPQENDGDLNS